MAKETRRQAGAAEKAAREVGRKVSREVKRRGARRGAVVAAVGLALGAGWTAIGAGPAAAQFARPAPAGTAAPRAVTDLASAVAQTAAVVEVTVAELHREYSDAEGPWTRAVLRDVKVHLGAAPAQLELWQFGGVLPGGRMMVAAELPVLGKGQRYVLFLRNTAWNLSPIVGQLAFRVERVDGAEVLVSSDGQALIGLDAAGPRFGAALFEPAPYTGAPAVARAGASAASGKPGGTASGRPMDRGRLLAALQRALDEQELEVAGTLRERPAGGFAWRGQPVARHGQQPADGAGRAGRDTSGGAR